MSFWAICLATTLISASAGMEANANALVLMQQRARMILQEPRTMDLSLIGKTSNTLDVLSQIKYINRTVDAMDMMVHDVKQTSEEASALVNNASALLLHALEQSTAVLKVATVVAGEPGQKALDWANRATVAANDVTTSLRTYIDKIDEKLQDKIEPFYMLRASFEDNLKSARDALQADHDATALEEKLYFQPELSKVVDNRCTAAQQYLHAANVTLDKGAEFLSKFNRSAVSCLNGVTTTVIQSMWMINQTANAGLAAANLCPDALKEKIVNALQSVLDVAEAVNRMVQSRLSDLEKGIDIQQGALIQLQNDMGKLTADVAKQCADVMKLLA